MLFLAFVVNIIAGKSTKIEFQHKGLFFKHCQSGGNRIMETSIYSKTFGYAVIAAGLVLSFASAVVPHYGHYKLMAGVLAIAVLPYVVYGIAVVFLKNTLAIAAGAVLLAIHAGLVIGERFSSTVDYSDGMIYVVPLALFLALMPLLVVALRQPWHQ